MGIGERICFELTGLMGVMGMVAGGDVRLLIFVCLCVEGKERGEGVRYRKGRGAGGCWMIIVYL